MVVGDRDCASMVDGVLELYVGVWVTESLSLYYRFFSPRFYQWEYRAFVSCHGMMTGLVMKREFDHVNEMVRHSITESRMMKRRRARSFCLLDLYVHYTFTVNPSSSYVKVILSRHREYMNELFPSPGSPRWVPPSHSLPTRDPPGSSRNPKPTFTSLPFTRETHDPKPAGALRLLFGGPRSGTSPIFPLTRDNPDEAGRAAVGG